MLQASADLSCFCLTIIDFPWSHLMFGLFLLMPLPYHGYRKWITKHGLWSRLVLAKWCLCTILMIFIYFVTVYGLLFKIFLLQILLWDELLPCPEKSIHKDTACRFLLYEHELINITIILIFHIWFWLSKSHFAIQFL